MTENECWVAPGHQDPLSASVLSHSACIVGDARASHPAHPQQTFHLALSVGKRNQSVGQVSAQLEVCLWQPGGLTATCASSQDAILGLLF